MLTLFRKIRKELIEMSAVRKYLLYAAGEVLLVMVGILLAQQVNNWNEHRKNHIIEIEMLKDIRTDLLATRDDLQGDAEANKVIRKATINVLNHMVNNLPYHDSLAAKLSVMLFTPTLFEKASAYETLKSRGLETNSNVNIRHGITNFYELSLTRSESNAPDLVEKILAPYMQKHFDINLDTTVLRYWPSHQTIPRRAGSLASGSLVGYVPRNYGQLKKDPEFRILLRDAIRRRGATIGRYNNSINALEELTRLIEDELNRM